MKVGIGKSRQFIVNDKKVRCVCTHIQYKEGLQLFYLREQLPPHNAFWYSPKLKTKVESPTSIQ